MNWVGGSRKRIMMKNDTKKQREYFAQKRLQKKLQTLGLPTSPKREGSGSMDLVTLFIVNQIASKKPTNIQPKVAHFKDLKGPKKAKPGELLALPMSPCSPSRLALAEAQPIHSTSFERERSFTKKKKYNYTLFKQPELSPVLESNMSDLSASDYQHSVRDSFSPFSVSSTASSSSAAGLFPSHQPTHSHTAPSHPLPWDTNSQSEHSQFNPYLPPSGGRERELWLADQAGPSGHMHTSTPLPRHQFGPRDPVASDSRIPDTPAFPFSVSDQAAPSSNMHTSTPLPRHQFGPRDPVASDSRIPDTPAFPFSVSDQAASSSNMHTSTPLPRHQFGPRDPVERRPPDTPAFPFSASEQRDPQQSLFRGFCNKNYNTPVISSGPFDNGSMNIHLQEEPAFPTRTQGLVESQFRDGQQDQRQDVFPFEDTGQGDAFEQESLKSESPSYSPREDYEASASDEEMDHCCCHHHTHDASSITQHNLADAQLHHSGTEKVRGVHNSGRHVPSTTARDHGSFGSAKDQYVPARNPPADTQRPMTPLSVASQPKPAPQTRDMGTQTTPSPHPTLIEASTQCCLPLDMEDTATQTEQQQQQQQHCRPPEHAVPTANSREQHEHKDESERARHRWLGCSTAAGASPVSLAEPHTPTAHSLTHTHAQERHSFNDNTHIPTSNTLTTLTHPPSAHTHTHTPSAHTHARTHTPTMHVHTHTPTALAHTHTHTAHTYGHTPTAHTHDHALTHTRELHTPWQAAAGSHTTTTMLKTPERGGGGRFGPVPTSTPAVVPWPVRTWAQQQRQPIVRQACLDADRPPTPFLGGKTLFHHQQYAEEVRGGQSPELKEEEEEEEEDRGGGGGGERREEERQEGDGRVAEESESDSENMEREREQERREEEDPWCENSTVSEETTMVREGVRRAAVEERARASETEVVAGEDKGAKRSRSEEEETPMVRTGVLRAGEGDGVGGLVVGAREIEVTAERGRGVKREQERREEGVWSENSTVSEQKTLVRSGAGKREGEREREVTVEENREQSAESSVCEEADSLQEIADILLMMKRRKESLT
ncbi:uncharacterized protein LOC134463770 isoform X1 [Engraulis encrasicolus]|uniref:uncharacterized protein LOC134463770 isoform X1 n=1 Tax=Engraulis encrasicolus TaxID=184585 RepID=UPI002FD5636A